MHLQCSHVGAGSIVGTLEAKA